ncbi:McrB family protein [Fibrobacter sp. UWB12]|uniref:McrB family protein n=1 Tax=Fibrobacter sp. UWB12 TaxID=1896203 RepID=UPI0009150F76|nr:AAA family ATPase [Fibrobacter sp. UWB12]SHK43055.1 AAA domain (dynein-related subfamily) [Fibrobacter sp. UWB12]
MAIPELSRENINQALLYIDENGVPPGYGSKAYDLIVNGKKYPPKYVVAVARHLKDGAAIDTSDYNGVEAKNYFKARGYEIFVKKEILPETNYWLTGTFFNKKDMIDDFVADSYWEGGQVNSSAIMTSIKSVKKGDVLIAKSTTTKGPNHSIPLLKVKAVGLVMSDMWQTEEPNWYKCDVEWIKLPEYKDYEGTAYGKYLGTMHLCKEQNLIGFAKKVLGITVIDDCSSYVNLLKANHNIILHGAPGTGKTYLAKKIAKAMGCGDDEIGFVQFHQSYDYTDFVEGLRPAKNNEDKVSGFELKKGVFKNFCEQAEKNWVDSKKTSNELQREKSVDERIETFLNEAVDSKKEFEIATGNKFYVENLTENFIEVSVPANEKSNELNLKISELKQLLLSDKEIIKGKDVREFFSRKRRLQEDSYIFALYQQLKSLDDKNNQDEKIKVDLKKYVFIIDEINRGEISKIFGELFFSIDPGYRGEKGRIKTQYQNLVDEDDVFAKGFFVPENVYIIGTMNDIDRSVESMDFAMRRRFAFKEIKADDRIEMLTDTEKGLGENAEEAIKRMQSLNKAIETTEGLSSAYDVGPAYFLKLKNYDGDFQQLWDYHIEGVLREYLRGIDDDGKKYEKLKNAYFIAELKEEKAGKTEE